MEGEHRTVSLTFAISLTSTPTPQLYRHTYARAHIAHTLVYTHDLAALK